jgi:hypothetical protein
LTGPRAARLQPPGKEKGIELRDPSPRRRRVFLFFAFLALAGTFIKWWAPAHSELSRFGSMLLVIWIPVASHFIFYLLKRRKRRAAGTQTAAADGGFRAELVAEVTFDWPLRNDGRHPVPGREYPCILAIGADGFSARFVVPAGATNAPDAARRVEVEFLVPALALPRFPAGATFRVLEGADFRGEGRVLEPVGGEARP